MAQCCAGAALRRPAASGTRPVADLRAVRFGGQLQPQEQATTGVGAKGQVEQQAPKRAEEVVAAGVQHLMWDGAGLSLQALSETTPMSAGPPTWSSSLFLGGWLRFRGCRS